MFFVTLIMVVKYFQCQGQTDYLVDIEVKCGYQWATFTELMSESFSHVRLRKRHPRGESVRMERAEPIMLGGHWAKVKRLGSLCISRDQKMRSLSQRSCHPVSVTKREDNSGSHVRKKKPCQRKIHIT